MQAGGFCSSVELLFPHSKLLAWTSLYRGKRMVGHVQFSTNLGLGCFRIKKKFLELKANF
jgi:hypothetical protein